MDDHHHQHKQNNNNNSKNKISGTKILIAGLVAFLVTGIILAWFFAIYLIHRRRRNGAAGREIKLNRSVIASMPTFVYSSATLETLECAVCLSEFKDGDRGRILPTCRHEFHADCVDGWFESHATCPLCRTPVDA